MDGRKWLLPVFVLCFACVGCVTQEQKKFTATPTPPHVTLPRAANEEKRTPKVDTLIALAKYHEGEARLSEKLTDGEKERLLANSRRLYSKAREFDPNNIEVILGLARIHTAFHEPSRAQALYQEALKKSPRDSRLWVALGKHYCQAKDYNRAAECFHKAHNLNPDDRDCAAVLGYTLVLAGRVQDSLQVFARLYGNEAKAHYRVALVMAWLQRFDQARQHAMLALRKDPTMMNARDMLAAIDRPAGADATASGRSSHGPAVRIGFHPADHGRPQFQQ